MDNFPIPRLLHEDNLPVNYPPLIVQRALVTALDVMSLGCVEQGNLIIDLLHDHDQLDYYDNLLREQLHYAWDASGSWPAAILNRDGNIIRCNWAGEGQFTKDGPEAVSEIKAATRRQWAKLLEKEPMEAAWTERDFNKACEKAAVPEPSQRDWFAPSIEIAFELNHDDLAIELVRKHLVTWHTDAKKYPYSWSCADHLQVLQSPRLWWLLASGWLRNELRVTTAQITQFVDESLAWLEGRLENGPARPYRYHSTEQLCHIFHDARRKTKQPEGDDDVNMDWLDRFDREETLKSPIFSPATENQILELEARAKENHYPEGLPEDYKTFLRVTNGLYSTEDGGGISDVLSSTDHIDFNGFIDEIELLPLHSLSGMASEIEFDWPYGERRFLNLVSDYYCDISVLDRATTQQAIAAFKERYDGASRDERKRIERAARDVYGSVEHLLKLEYVVVRWIHKYVGLEGVYPSFRHLLETIVMEAVGLPAAEDEDGNGDEKNKSRSDEKQGDEGDHDNDGTPVDRKRTASPSDPPPREPSATKHARVEE